MVQTDLNPKQLLPAWMVLEESKTYQPKQYRLKDCDVRGHLPKKKAVPEFPTLPVSLNVLRE